MARDFDFGADVATGGGKVFKNPEVGPHDAILGAVIHVGSYQDVFVKGSAREEKKPVNYVLLQAILMGDEDFNEDGSRMEAWRAVGLKSGDKAELTVLMNALDPQEKLSGFDECIGVPFIATMKGSDDKGEDGLPLYVNWASKGFSGCPGKLAKLVSASVEEEGIKTIGHVKFNDITKEVLDAIPAHLVRQYFMSEHKHGAKNLSVPGSHVETIIAAAREADPKWKAPADKDAKPDDKKPLDTGATVPAQDVPPADNVPAPDMDEGAEY
ncbi:hypothetical protein [Klebsiella phage vB_KvaP_F5M1D]|nr:hypothetical protein [Klebsiella phage vB_KvaP_F5M1D]